jgi:glycosyltransferase involved in cell wall biosynthesis
MARELVRRSHQVTIAALHSDYNSLTEKRFEKEGVDVWYVAPMHVHKSGNTKRYYPTWELLLVTLRAIWSLSIAGLSVPTDIIYIGKPHPMNGIAGLLAKVLKRRKVFLDCDDIEVGVNRFGAGWQKLVVAFFERKLPLLMDKVTSHTHTNRQRLIGFSVSENRVLYIPNGVERQRFCPPPPERVNTLRKQLELDGKHVITFIGSMGLASHPVNLLLDAFAILIKELPESILLFVGGGEDFEKIQAYTQALGLQDAVRFCGRVSPTDVVLYYHLADVSVDPVYDDDAARGRSPLKLFESWACGTPFVTCDVGDRRSLLGDPPAGLLAKAGDSISLANAIKQIICDPTVAYTLQQRGLANVQGYFWDQLAVVLETAFQNEIQDSMAK